MLRRIYPAQLYCTPVCVKSSEVYRMQSDCLAVTHAVLNNERLFAWPGVWVKTGLH